MACTVEKKTLTQKCLADALPQTDHHHLKDTGYFLCTFRAASMVLLKAFCRFSMSSEYVLCAQEFPRHRLGLLLCCCVRYDPSLTPSDPTDNFLSHMVAVTTSFGPFPFI